MSLVSNGSLNENTTPYIGIFSRSGLRPYCASSSAARSSASGCWRKYSHTGGAPGGSGPSDGCRSKSPLQVTERSPRMLSVPSALTWPAFGMPTIMPNCCCTVGSEAVGSMRPNSSGGPWYLSRSGRRVGRLDGLRRKLAAASRRAPCRSPPAPARRPPSPARSRRRCRRARARCSAERPRPRGLARPDRAVQIVDRRFFELERLCRVFGHHTRPSGQSESPRSAVIIRERG